MENAYDIILLYISMWIHYNVCIYTIFKIYNYMNDAVAPYTRPYKHLGRTMQLTM